MSKNVKRNRTCVEFHCGVQWNSIELGHESNVEGVARALERFEKESAASATRRTLDEALNTGDGTYKP